MTTKEKIIDTSIELFSKEGYNGVSIRDITKIVGIRESSLYKHFKSKEEILNKIFEIFLLSYNQSDLSEKELTEILSRVDLLTFLNISLEKFFQDMEIPELERIFRVMMIEQFRLEKARNIILNYLIHFPIELYSMAFRIKLKDQFSDYNLLAREFHYPIFAMVYEYSLTKYSNGKYSEIKKQVFDHINFFYHKVLNVK